MPNCYTLRRIASLLRTIAGLAAVIAVEFGILLLLLI
jgi:hypothetical protein